MSLTVAVVALITGIAVWALLVRGLREKSWETPGATAGPGDRGGIAALPARKIGLWAFLGVITSLFGLFIAAYSIRMGTLFGEGHGSGNWISVAEPQVLWLNTALLVLASVAMQVARVAAGRGALKAARAGLYAGGALTIGFLVGQWLAWQQLEGAPFLVPGNPAVAFFYLLTAVHGLHLLGGLVVWARTADRLRGPQAALADHSLTIELCSVYWHYLLLVWLVLFALLLRT